MRGMVWGRHVTIRALLKLVLPYYEFLGENVWFTCVSNSLAVSTARRIVWYGNVCNSPCCFHDFDSIEGTTISSDATCHSLPSHRPSFYLFAATKESTTTILHKQYYHFAMQLFIAAGIAFIAASVQSFPVVAFSSVAIRCPVTTSTWRASPAIKTLAVRHMSEESAEESNVGTEEAADSVSEESEPVAENKLDPAVVELKENIAKLEADVKRKKGELADLKEMAERYSQTGYARQVALLENNKRRRGENVADNKSAARAKVIQSFVPVLDELDAVAARYEGNSFAKSLDALRSGMKSSLGELGVSEFVVGAGDAVDSRVVAVDEQFSEEFAAGTVISALTSGLEIQGNIVRAAKVVASLGVENSEEEGAAEEAVSDSDDGGDSDQV